MVNRPDARLRWLDAVQVAVTVALTVVVMGVVPGSAVSPIRGTPVQALDDPAERVAMRFLRAVVADQSLDACSFVTPEFGWINPCLDELTRRRARFAELRIALSSQVGVSPGVATSPTRVDFTAEQLTPRPNGLALSLTVERDRNNEWKVSRLDDVPIPSG